MKVKIKQEYLKYQIQAVSAHENIYAFYNLESIRQFFYDFLKIRFPDGPF